MKRAAKSAKPVKPTPPQYPLVHVGFDDFRFELDRALLSGSMVGNFGVKFRRYRITVEVIDEPVDVLKARLVKLWRGTSNHHDRPKLVAAAKTIGVALDPEEFGADVKKGERY